MTQKKLLVRKPFSIGKRVVKCEQFPNAWKIVEIKDIELGKPCVLCFGGNATITDRSANGMAKIAEGLIDPTMKQALANVYSVSYGGNELGVTGDLTYEEVERLARGIFYPRVADKDGNAFDYEQCAKNCRNISVFSYSFGAKVLNCMMYNVAQMMEYELGFSEREIEGILKQVYHVSYAPSCKKNVLTSNFEIKSLRDEAVDFENEYYDKFVDDIEEYAIDVDGSTVSLYVNNLSDDLESREHNIAIFKRDKMGRTHDEKANKFVDLTSKLLRLSVENSILNNEIDEFVPMKPARKIEEIVRNDLGCQKVFKHREVEKEGITI